MKTNIIETITNTLDANRKLLKQKKVEVYVLYPDQNKVLFNKVTEKIIRGFITLNTKEAIENYTEIDDPELED